METLKTEIKALALEQKDLKNQRKTVHMVGERKIPTWEASYKHSSNRSKLRMLYMTLGLLNGLTPEQVETKPKKENPDREVLNMDVVYKLVEKYGKEQTVRIDS